MSLESTYRRIYFFYDFRFLTTHAPAQDLYLGVKHQTLLTIILFLAHELLVLLAVQIITSPYFLRRPRFFGTIGSMYPG